MITWLWPRRSRRALLLSPVLLLVVGAVTAPPVVAQDYTLAASPSTVSPGGMLTVSWTAPAGRPATDWVGLYRVGAPDDQSSLLSWQYTGGTASGSRNFTAPEPEGPYEFRYYLEDGFTRRASSGPVTVRVTARPPVSPAAQVGRWAASPGWPAAAAHAVLLPTGVDGTPKVLFWPRPYEGAARLWDPATGAFGNVPPVPGEYDIWCSGHSLMADGRVLIAGGWVHDSDIQYADGAGVRNASIYDPERNSWQALRDMNLGRWYPSCLTLAGGDVLVLGGTYDADPTSREDPYVPNNLPQVWTGSGWRDLEAASQHSAPPPGGQPRDPLPVPTYPFLHLAPNGRVFLAGPNQATFYLDTAGGAGVTRPWSFVDDREFPNRDYGASVMYEPGRVLFVGGGQDPPTATAEVIDLNVSSPAWRAVGSMSVARRQLNATILPDGRVLVTGGTTGPGYGWTEPGREPQAVFGAELWDPQTGQFRPMANMPGPGRWYHSVALLLPDGRVLSTGGDNTRLEGGQWTTSNRNAEIFSPPYLFSAGDTPAARPQIGANPAAGSSAGYDADLSIDIATLGGGNSVASVTLVRLGSATHTRNMDQRFMRLEIRAPAPAPNRVTVRTPANANVCPPGYYMLFVLNNSGVPSVARIIRIG